MERGELTFSNNSRISALLTRPRGRGGVLRGSGSAPSSSCFILTSWEITTSPSSPLLDSSFSLSSRSFLADGGTDRSVLWRFGRGCDVRAAGRGGTGDAEIGGKILRRAARDTFTRFESEKRAGGGAEGLARVQVCEPA